MTAPTDWSIDRVKSEVPSHVNNQQAKAWWRSGLTRKTRNLVPSGASVRIRPTSKSSFPAGAFIFRVFPKKRRNLRFRFGDFVCHGLEAESSRAQRTARSGQRQEPSHRRSAGRKVCFRNPPPPPTLWRKAAQAIGCAFRCALTALCSTRLAKRRPS